MTEIEVSRRERKKDETRQRIFNAAIRLFRDRGFEVTTVDDITEKADVAKGTFFNYFPRKDAVLAYLSDQNLEVMESRAGTLLAEKKPAREKLIEIYTRCATTYAQDRELSRYVLNELMHRAFKPTEDSWSRWQSLIVRMIEQGQEAGELARGLDLERAEAVLTSVYYALLFRWANCQELEIDVEDEMRRRLTLAMEGMIVAGARR